MIATRTGEGVAAPAPRGYTLERFARFLVARFYAPHDVASWALVGGGLRSADAVAWMEVGDHELRPPVDAESFFRARLGRAGLAESVGMMTSRALDAFVEASHIEGSVRASSVATVGLGNALRAGDPPGVAARIGTINILCRVDRALTPAALLEAIAIATEAKTAAVLEAGITSRRTSRAATGTGTDCIVVAAPKGRPRARYAGKHTDVGAAIGASVEDAIARGVRAWLEEQGDHLKRSPPVVEGREASP